MSIAQKEFSKDDFLARLVSEDVLEASAASRARGAAELSGASIEHTVLELGLVGEETLFRALARHVGQPFVGPDQIDLGLLERLDLDRGFLERVSSVPVYEKDGHLMVATTTPDSHSVLESIAFYLSVPVVAAITSPSTVRDVLAEKSGTDGAEASASDSDVERLRALANDGPVVKYVNDMIAKAASARASDIHFEAQDNGARVRFRVDGMLAVEGSVTADRLAAVVSRVKVMASLNISEKRRPQDGRITLPVRGRNIDIRVSTLPTQYGESVVMRLLDQERVDLDWTYLGFDATRVTNLRKITAQPNGIFLVAGPTGSGKTTTLYTALKDINQEDRKIVTVEDPIEYSLPGINQTQVDGAIDMTFARALRAILRQDPDVVMVGEIRDQETAEIAVRAALIGRLVLSTIHTNDSISAISRLIDLGVPPYLLASTLRGVLSQRLVPRICADCGGDGGECCSGSGRKGRQVVSELLRVTPAISESIASGASLQELEQVAKAEGFDSMRKEARQLVKSGRVSDAWIETALGFE